MENRSILDLYAFTFKENNYSPIAGKILGLFYISDQKFFTFEELIEELGVSKSAISKALKMLLEVGEINFQTFKNSKRKRHFYLDIQGSIDRMQRIIDAYSIQTQLLEETLQIRSSENQELNKFIANSIKFNKEVLSYFDKKFNDHFKN